MFHQKRIVKRLPETQYKRQKKICQYIKREIKYKN